MALSVRLRNTLYSRLVLPRTTMFGCKWLQNVISFLCSCSAVSFCMFDTISDMFTFSSLIISGASSMRLSVEMSCSSDVRRWLCA